MWKFIFSCLDTGIGVYNGLFHSTAITHSFDQFVHIIGAIILLLFPFTEGSTDLTSILLSVIPGIKIEVTNIETGVCTIYESLREAANALNMSAGTISRRIKLNIIKPYKGKFLIKAYENSE